MDAQEAALPPDRPRSDLDLSVALRERRNLQLLRFGSLALGYSEILQHIEQVPAFFGASISAFWAPYRNELYEVAVEYGIELPPMRFSRDQHKG